MPIYKEDYNRDYIARYKVSIRHIPTNSGYVDLGTSERKTPMPAMRDVMKHRGPYIYSLMEKLAGRHGNFEHNWEFIVQPCADPNECIFAEFIDGNMPELEGVRVPYAERFSAGRRTKPVM